MAGVRRRDAMPTAVAMEPPNENVVELDACDARDVALLNAVFLVWIYVPALCGGFPRVLPCVRCENAMFGGYFFRFRFIGKVAGSRTYDYVRALDPV